MALQRHLGQLTESKCHKMYFGHVMRKKGDSLEKEIMQGTTPGSRSRGRPKIAWMSNITSWTGLSVEQLLRDGRHQWRLTAHDAANLRTHEDGWRQDKYSFSDDDLFGSSACKLDLLHWCGMFSHDDDSVMSFNVELSMNYDDSDDLSFFYTTMTFICTLKTWHLHIATRWFL